MFYRVLCVSQLGVSHCQTISDFRVVFGSLFKIIEHFSRPRLLSRPCVSNSSICRHVTTSNSFSQAGLIFLADSNGFAVLACSRVGNCERVRICRLRIFETRNLFRKCRQLIEFVAVLPDRKIVLQNYFSVRQYRHEFDELPALAEQIASLENSQPANTNTLTIAYTRTGQYGKAVRIGEEYQASLAERIGSGYVTANRAVAYARTGQESRSREMLDYLEQRAKNDSEIGYRLAMAYAELGYTEDAIKHLQRCLVAHDDRLVWLLVESYFDSLRGDPRFQEILRKMKLDASSPSITK